MAGMVRKQVYIEPKQDQFLKERADELGVTEAELIRQGINLLAHSPTTRLADLDAWADEEAFLESRAHVSPSQPGTLQFQREGIYEDRVGRIPG